MDNSVNGIIPDDSLLPKLVTYTKLRCNEVQNIASVVCGGDVYEEGSDRLQRTLSHRYITFYDGKQEKEPEESVLDKGKEKGTSAEKG